MKIILSKNAVKFLDSCIVKDRERIKKKVRVLFEAINQQSSIPFKELDIKKLKGDWKGFLRMRIGKVRVIFRVDRIDKEIIIYEIDYRGNLYK